VVEIGRVDARLVKIGRDLVEPGRTYLEKLGQSSFPPLVPETAQFFRSGLVRVSISAALFRAAEDLPGVEDQAAMVEVSLGGDTHPSSDRYKRYTTKNVLARSIEPS
jgi:hypothetical protein